MFTLEDTPEIKNRNPIHVATMGWQAQWTVPPMKEWAEYTGIPVTYEIHTNEMTYAKLNVELVLGTGAYDLVPVEAAFMCEWAPYLWPLYELADEFDPGGRASMAIDLEQHYSAILREGSDRDGTIYGCPLTTYQDAMWLRLDAFEDATEQADFSARYGYALKPPTEWEELYDQGEFFTRKKGELFKGKPLPWDLYGLNVEGKSEINDDISAEIWGRDGHWFDIVRDHEGKAIEYVVTEANRQVLREALTSEKMQLQWASPICVTSYWNDLVPLWREGRVIIWPHQYIHFTGWGREVEGIIPGAKMGLARGINGTGLYTGHYPAAISVGSKNPEGSYWLVKYLNSFEAQTAMFEDNNAVTRMDILRNPKYQTPEWAGFQGPYALALDDIFTNVQTWDVVNDYIWFNSTAGGKMYEMTIVETHEAMTGRKTIEQATDDILRQFIELETKFGDMPMRSEIEL